MKFLSVSLEKTTWNSWPNYNEHYQGTWKEIWKHMSQMTNFLESFLSDISSTFDNCEDFLTVNGPIRRHCKDFFLGIPFGDRPGCV